MTAEELCLDFINNHSVSADEFLSEEQQEQSSSRISEKKEKIEPLPCDSFEELVSIYRKYLYWSKAMEDTLTFMLAVILSPKIGGELVWSYIVGPPSSGKSALCDAVTAAQEHCVQVNKITGIHSGFKTGKSKKDHSVLKLVNGKTMIVKDWTSILVLPPMLLENIYGELRDIYDGSVNTHYRTDVKRSYKNIRFGMLAGVTDEILRQNHGHLGERLLRIDLTDKNTGSHRHVSTALGFIVDGVRASFPSQLAANEEGEKPVSPDRLLELKRRTVGFIEAIMERIATTAPPEISPEMHEKITVLARLTERIRGRVAREGGSEREIAYRPRPAVAVRLASQLAKTGMLLAVVLDKGELDDEVFRILRKIAHDTSAGPTYDIVRILMEAHQEGEIGLSIQQIANKIEYIREGAIHRKLVDLSHLKMVQNVEIPNKHGVRGRNKHLWEVIPYVRKMWDALMPN